MIGTIAAEEGFMDGRDEPTEKGAGAPPLTVTACPIHPQFVHPIDGECPECARIAADLEAERYERAERASRTHGLAMARLWAPVVALVILGFFAMITLAIWRISTEHERTHTHQVTVWCYADSNSTDATSQITGTPDQVARFCPDQHWGP